MSTKKKIHPGRLELDAHEACINVHYETQEWAMAGDGAATLVSSIPGIKRLKVRSVTSSAAIPELAQQIVGKCRLIHSSKIPQVAALLHELLQRDSGSLGAQVKPGQFAIAYSSADKQQLWQRNQERFASAQESEPEQPALLEHLASYIEHLYDEDIQGKVAAASQIATLFRQSTQLQSLLAEAALLPTLARILRDDGRRSVDLCLAIESVFFALSNFSQAHQLLLDNQVGAVTLEVIDLELQRADHREEEAGGSAAIAQRVAAGTATKQDRKLLLASQKQDRLLYICTYLLLNLAEDPAIERKMHKKQLDALRVPVLARSGLRGAGTPTPPRLLQKLVPCLVRMLGRTNLELLILVVTFLRKLSVFAESKNQMAACEVVAPLARLMDASNEVLLAAVLRLLHNLSFDDTLKADMVKHGLVPKAVALMRDPAFQSLALGLLYHISQEERHRTMFTYTDAVPAMHAMLMGTRDLRGMPELIALAVNLTQNARIAEAMCVGDRLAQLIQHALQMRDELLFKVLRNISQQEEVGVKERFVPYIDALVGLLKAPDIDSDVFVEVLGCLATLSIPGFDWHPIIAKHDLVHFLTGYTQLGVTEDDILLEVVMLVGVLCSETTAAALVDSGLVDSMYLMMAEKKEDDEFVLQITHSLYSLLMYDPTRDLLLNTTQVVFYLVDLLQDKHPEVSKAADRALDVIMDTNEQWAVKLRALKFEAHNQDWLEATERMDAEGLHQPEGASVLDQHSSESKHSSGGLYVHDSTVVGFEDLQNAGLWEQAGLLAVPVADQHIVDDSAITPDLDSSQEDGRGEAEAEML